MITLRLLLASMVTSLGIVSTSQAGFFTSTSGPLSIPDANTSVPYPLTFNVAGVTGPVTNVSLTLTGYTHSFTNDVSMMLVGPTGAGMIVFSGGAINSVTGINLTFMDGGAVWPTAPSNLTPGTYQPTIDINGVSRTFPAPAPSIPGVNPIGAAPGLSSFALFNGLDPNGTWSLYSADFVGGDSGSVTSVSLNITTLDSPSAVPVPPTAFAFVAGLIGFVSARRFRKS